MVSWIKNISLICVMLLAIGMQQRVDASGTVGTSGAEFLNIGIGSRPLGMGEAFTAATNDINAIYYNPAGLGTLKYPMLSVMHQELIVDSRFENVSAAFPLYKGFMGISSTVFWVPPFDKINIDGENTGKVNFYNTALTAAYGQSLGFMEIGGSFKYIYQKIDTLDVHSAAVDIGVLKRLYMYSPFDAPVRNFTLGMSILNIGTTANDDPLPRSIRIGTSYYLTKWVGFYCDFIENMINASDIFDFTYGFDESFRINTGIEFTYMDILSFRCGYRFNDVGTYTFGVGFNYAIKNVSFVIDTSYAETSIFGPNYSFNVSVKLIPQVITVDDKLKAEVHYRKGIKYYIANDIDGAIEEFKKCKDYDPYHKNVKQKIEDLEELKKLKEENERMEQKFEGVK